MSEPKDRWDKTQIISAAIGAVFIPLAVLYGTEKYKEVEKRRTAAEQQVERQRTQELAAAQIHLAEVGAVVPLLESLINQSDVHKQEMAFRVLAIAMPREAPDILKIVRDWSTPATTPIPATTPANTSTAQIVDSVLRNAQQQAVIDLFNPSDGKARGRAYDQIAHSAWRTDIALADAILKAANEHFDFKRGINNAVVALRDMSRQATQDPSVQGRILEFADKVKKTYPELDQDTDSLIKWVKEKEKPAAPSR